MRRVNAKNLRFVVGLPRAPFTKYVKGYGTPRKASDEIPKMVNGPQDSFHKPRLGTREAE
jgi:hypothetical protein